MSETPAPGFTLTAQTTFKTTEDARASYGFCAPPEPGTLTPAPRLTPDLCAVIDYARRELRDDLADDAVVELSALLAEVSRLTARVAQQQDDLARQEVQMLRLIEQGLEVQRAALNNLPE